jgi:hypothetical protein
MEVAGATVVLKKVEVASIIEDKFKCSGLKPLARKLLLVQQSICLLSTACDSKSSILWVPFLLFSTI